MDYDLDIAFREAFNEISKLKEAIAPDIMLKFYAYNKQAKKEYIKLAKSLLNNKK
jgi:diazepam-binding inhibitor (GABA receptor modulator, acyl-CoA-binding protein)